MEKFQAQRRSGQRPSHRDPSPLSLPHPHPQPHSAASRGSEPWARKVEFCSLEHASPLAWQEKLNGWAGGRDPEAPALEEGEEGKFAEIVYGFRKCLPSASHI